MHGYDVSSSPPTDVSRHGLGGPWADGAIVSNARDLAVFFGALLRGRLVPRRLVEQMATIVPARTGRAWACTGSARRAGAGSTGTPAARPATSRSPPARATPRHLVVFAVNGVNPYAMEALVGRYLDEVLCRR